MGKILKKAKIPTDVKGGGQAILNQVKNLVWELQADHKLSGIAVSTAGQINRKEGTVIYATDSLPRLYRFEYQTGIRI